MANSSDLKRTRMVKAASDLEHEDVKKSNTTCNSGSKQLVESLRNKRVAAVMEMKEAAENGASSVEESCRERLKRHRSEMSARRVRIPETWGQEMLLHDWKDCASISRSLFPAGFLLAREALVEEFANPCRVPLGNSSCI